MTRYRPVEVDLPDGRTFEVHLDRPGKPKVYHRRGDGHLLRIQADDPALNDIARALREGVDRKKEAEERERNRKQTFRYRFFRAIGEWWARMLKALRFP